MKLELGASHLLFKYRIVRRVYSKPTVVRVNLHHVEGMLQSPPPGVTTKYEADLVLGCWCTIVFHLCLFDHINHSFQVEVLVKDLFYRR